MNGDGIKRCSEDTRIQQISVINLLRKIYYFEFSMHKLSLVDNVGPFVTQKGLGSSTPLRGRILCIMTNARVATASNTRRSAAARQI